MFRNWSGSVRSNPVLRHRPRDEAGVARLLRAAEAQDRFRVVGSAHSFTPLCATDQHLIDVGHLSGVTAVDTGSGRARVGAGTTIHALGPKLAAHGLALANQGDIDRQTLAGAISTGTHGTGATLGALSTQVRALRLITPAGEAWEADGDTDPERLAASVVSLGTLGVVTALTVQCRPAYRLEDRRWGASLDAVLEDLDAHVAGHRHFEFFWFPQSDVAACKSLDETEAMVSPPSLYERASGMLIENGGMTLLSEWCRWQPSASQRATGVILRMPAGRTVVEESWRVFPSARWTRFNEMEYALPRAAGPDCMREIRAWFRAHRPPVLFPVEYRTVAGDDLWLSPFHGRDSATIAVHQYAPVPHGGYFAAMEAIFRNHGGRPHWGKHHNLRGDDLATLYPQWEAFHDLRRTLDPQGRMLNDYLRALFGRWA